MCVCFFLHLSAIFARLSAWCHIATCFFADVVDFSLVTTLFCFISLDTLLATFCVCIECLCVCFLVSLSVPAKLSASSHIVTCFFVDAVHFSLVTTLFCFISLDTLLATFLCLYLVFICMFTCVSLGFL